jgi:hypothetical protein
VWFMPAIATAAVVPTELIHCIFLGLKQPQQVLSCYFCRSANLLPRRPSQSGHSDQLVGQEGVSVAVQPPSWNTN